MPQLSVLGSNFEKTLSYLQSAPLNSPYSKVWCQKEKSLNLEPKMSDFCILGMEFENIIVILEVSVF